MCVVSRRRSSMVINTVPWRVMICFRLKVLNGSLGGSKAVFRSAKGSLISTRDALCVDSGLCPAELLRPAVLSSGSRSSLVVVASTAMAMGCWSSGASSSEFLDSLAACSSASKVGARARLACTVCGATSSPSTFSSDMISIFVSAFSIFRMVAISTTLKFTSSTLVFAIWGCSVKWRKRHNSRMTCATSTSPFGGNRPLSTSLTCVTRNSWMGALTAWTKPSLPCKSKTSSGMSFFLFCLSMIAVMKYPTHRNENLFSAREMKDKLGADVMSGQMSWHEFMVSWFCPRSSICNDVQSASTCTRGRKDVSLMPVPRSNACERSLLLIHPSTMRMSFVETWALLSSSSGEGLPDLPSKVMPLRMPLPPESGAAPDVSTSCRRICSCCDSASTRSRLLTSSSSCLARRTMRPRMVSISSCFCLSCSL
mmetsp:Transcript_28713/g.79025  ORF Transcript_28713/g.79025 Transcript_28713/m.79025 type:complete len:425 (+) Transcript_28713:745-2019(+)